MDYSIKDLANLSGIKAHTIRIWEQRYDILEPDRTSTNIRRYSENDLKRILNIAILNRHGKKISHIAQLTPQAIEQEVLKLHKSTGDDSVIMDRMVNAMVDLNDEELEGIINDLLRTVDFEELVIRFFFPFLEHIGTLWQTGSINPSQEHFISNYIRSKIIAETSSLKISLYKSNPRFLLYLREEEFHELGLLYVNYLLKKGGFKTLYLGQSVPYQDLEKVCQTFDPQYFVSSFIGTNIVPDADTYIEQLVEAFDHVDIWVIGYNNINYRNPERITFFNSYAQINSTINQISR